MLGWLLVGLRFTRAFLGGGSAGRVPLYLPALGDSTSSSLSDVVPGSAPSAWVSAQAEGLSGSELRPYSFTRTPKGLAGQIWDGLGRGSDDSTRDPGGLTACSGRCRSPPR